MLGFKSPVQSGLFPFFDKTRTITGPIIYFRGQDQDQTEQNQSISVWSQLSDQSRLVTTGYIYVLWLSQLGLSTTQIITRIDLVVHEILMKQCLNILCVKEVGTEIKLLLVKIQNLVSSESSQRGLSTALTITKISVVVHNLLMKQCLKILCGKEVSTEIELLLVKIWNLLSSELSQQELSTDLIITKISLLVHKLLIKQCLNSLLTWSWPEGGHRNSTTTQKNIKPSIVRIVSTRAFHCPINYKD
jgi:hypothetical protein